MEFLEKSLRENDILISATQIEQFKEYMDMIIETNRLYNLTAITDPREIEILHFWDSLRIIPFLRKIAEERNLLFSGCSIIDLGTGAGFPGMAIKILFPEIKMTLADSLKKRVVFLEKVKNNLGLKNISCLHARAEDLGANPGHREKYDIALARAVASLPVLCEYCIPLVKTGGVFGAMKSGYKDELKNSQIAIEKLGGNTPRVFEYYLKDDEIFRSFIVTEKIRKTPVGFPRKSGIPSRSPL